MIWDSRLAQHWLLLALLSSFAPVALAADMENSPVACSNVDYGRTHLGAGPDRNTTPNPEGPTLVAMGVFVTQLYSLDAVLGTYEFRGHVRSTWCDPRLAFDAKEAGKAEIVYMSAEAERELARIWFPGGFPVNRAGGFEVSERLLRVAANGTVHSDINIGVTLEASFSLFMFPFDRQELALVAESLRWPSKDVVLIADETSTGFATDFVMQEWEIEGVSSQVEEVNSVRHPDAFSRFNFVIDVQRHPGFYLWKVLLPIFIIVAISWSVFWMPDEGVATRTRITATGVLTVVAYQFVIAEDLPRIAYLTMLDKLMLGSFCLLAVTVVQSMLVAHFREREPETAMRIDRTSRWLFPLGYAAMVVVVVLTC